MVQVYGVPLQLWEGSTFDRTGQILGKVVDFSAASIESGNLSFDVIGILVKNPLRISTSINLEWEGRTYPVWIQESFRCWAPDFIKEKSGCSLASLSYASSPGGGESFSPAKVNPSPVDPRGEESEPDKEGYSAACMGSSPAVNSKTETIINCMGM
ncbi:hypothetical protein L1987_30640 [Smallanthus sonchifolius]|uniref:Uncharacterized protein n=1 Tax=Smallanthus sonchifolius TaxID=185202 RepID=A0ACB9I356_9ASTR|nr:hypothetical protein L1987_30640 [Smallanthus sonchifolius]